jgi:hypothetical protein
MHLVYYVAFKTQQKYLVTIGYNSVYSSVNTIVTNYYCGHVQNEKVFASQKEIRRGVSSIYILPQNRLFA